MLRVLPMRRPFDYLASRRTVDGQELCPVGLCSSRHVERCLEMEADLHKWHIAPYPGPTRSWPAAALDILRLIRRTNAEIQEECWQRDKRKAEEDAGDG